MTEHPRYRATGSKVETEKLRHPSVIEAICEFRFSRTVSYTMIPGAMKERLRPTFSSFEILPAAQMMAGIPAEAMIPPMPHHRFKSQVPNALVQTGPRLLTVNVLPVYPTYEVFRKLILDTFASFQDVAECGNPVSLTLRYINHFPWSSGKKSVSDYLGWAVTYPKQLLHPPQAVAARVVLPFQDLGNLSISVSSPSQVGSGQIGVLLDLEISESNPDGLDSKTFPEWLNVAHGAIYSAFQSSVKKEIMDGMRGR